MYTFVDLLCCGIRGDVLVNNRLYSAVVLQLLQSAVYLVEQLGVALLDSDCVILVSVSGVEDLEAAVCSNVVLCRLLVDNNAVNLAVYQCSNCERAVVELLYMLLTVVIGAVDVAGGAGLNADALAFQIIRRSDIGTILNSYGGKVALVPMRSVPPSAEVEVVESCASLLESAVLEPPQPVSSIEPASTMLSIAMENFFICVNSFRFDPCKTGISFKQ